MFFRFNYRDAACTPAIVEGTNERDAIHKLRHLLSPFEVAKMESVGPVCFPLTKREIVADKYTPLPPQ